MNVVAPPVHEQSDPALSLLLVFRSSVRAPVAITVLQPLLQAARRKYAVEQVTRESGKAVLLRLVRIARGRDKGGMAPAARIVMLVKDKSRTSCVCIMGWRASHIRKS